MISTRNTIENIFRDVLKENDVALKENITDDLVLLETGLDSLGYAVLVVRLESKLGYDPFVMMEEPIYPRTFGEFVAIYQRSSISDIK